MFKDQVLSMCISVFKVGDEGEEGGEWTECRSLMVPYTQQRSERLIVDAYNQSM